MDNVEYYLKLKHLEELIFETPKLEDCIALNELFKRDRSQFVTPRGFEPRLPGWEPGVLGL